MGWLDLLVEEEKDDVEGDLGVEDKCSVFAGLGSACVGELIDYSVGILLGLGWLVSRNRLTIVEAFWEM
jgi:hypothetical protein